MISGSRRPTLGQRMVLYGILAALVLLATFPFYWMLLTSLKTGRAVFDTTQVLLARDLASRTTWICSAQPASCVRSDHHGAGNGEHGHHADHQHPGGLQYHRLSLPGTKIRQFRGLSFLRDPASNAVHPVVSAAQQSTLGQYVPGTGARKPDFLVPFCTWLLLGYFRTLPKELKDAALIDGCTPLGVLWRIILPLAAPGIATAIAIFSFTQCWNEFLYAAVAWRKAAT